MDLEHVAQQSTLFRFLDPPGRKRMLALAEPQLFAPGEIIIREGEVGDAFYLILNGEVSVLIDDFGRAKEMATLSQGMFFGEIAVITSQPRSATVAAISPVQVLRFGKPGIDDLLNNYPRIREILSRMGIKRSEDTLEKMMQDDDLPLDKNVDEECDDESEEEL